MDSWKDHLFYGLIVELIVLTILFFKFNSDFELVLIPYFIIIMFVSPLLLDLDHKLGKLREGMTFLGLMIGLIGVGGYAFDLHTEMLMFVGIVIAGFAYLICYTTHHRGFVHSILFCIGYTIVIYFTFGNISLSILGFVGSYIHLIFDKIPLKIL